MRKNKRTAPAKKRPRPAAAGSGVAGGKGGAETLTALARLHGVSHPAVLKWFKHVGWAENGFRTRGPWSAAEVARQRTWRKNLQEDRSKSIDEDGGEVGGAGEGSLARLKTITTIQLGQSRKKYLDLQREIKQQAYLLRAEAEAQQAEKFRVVRTALMNLPKELRQLLADTTDPGRVEEILEKSLQALCAEGFER